MDFSQHPLSLGSGFGLQVLGSRTYQFPPADGNVAQINATPEAFTEVKSGDKGLLGSQQLEH